MLLAFFLGQTPALSLAELHAVCARAGLRMVPHVWSPDVMLAEVTGASDIQQLFPRLAGIIKIAEMTATLPHMPAAEDIRALLPQTSRKIFFGISSYSMARGAGPVRVKRLGPAVKKLLDEEGRSARWVTSRDDTLSAVVVRTNKLLSDRGAEIVILSLTQGSHLGRTVWVQPYDEYAARDMGRPMRDAKVGMLPPKLARMMVNIAQISEGATLLDPFCGSGTVLQEASLLGVTNLIGTDHDGHAIKRTHENLQWLSHMTPSLRTARYALTLKLADVRTLSDTLGGGVVDTVVTEPFLGPPRTRPMQEDEYARFRYEIEDLFRAAFHSFARVVRPRGRVVMVWPVWRVGREGWEFLESQTDAEHAGFEVRDPLGLPLDPLPGEQDGYCARRASLLYRREDQQVMREVRLFEKQ